MHGWVAAAADSLSRARTVARQQALARLRPQRLVIASQWVPTPLSLAGTLSGITETVQIPDVVEENAEDEGEIDGDDHAEVDEAVVAPAGSVEVRVCHGDVPVGAPEVLNMVLVSASHHACRFGNSL